jgi:hypothetical protein
MSALTQQIKSAVEVMRKLQVALLKRCADEVSTQEEYERWVEVEGEKGPAEGDEELIEDLRDIDDQLDDVIAALEKLEV